ncbi:MAG: stage III sporulation protein AF [Clostridia bacterium]|nr:stage III sporulation protein AF [Clostridia bacterium]
MIISDYIFRICICLALFSFAEILLPESSLKNIGKFSLGLIYILIILSPISNF